MKKVLILISMVALSSMVLAQKGSWYVGGVAGYGSATNKDTDGKKDITTNWSFGPEVGTFLKDDIQLGIVIGLDGSKSKFDGTEYQSSSGFNPTLYGRKFCKITDNFSLFTGLYFNFISGKVTDTDTIFGSVDRKEAGYGVRLGIGLAYALSPRFTVVGQYGLVGYQMVKYETAGKDAGSDSGFDFGVNTVGSSSFVQGNGSGSAFNIGVYYTFCTGQKK